MDDIERLEKLISSGHPCISIVTHEENDALNIIRQASLGLKRPLLLWSLGYGVREGLLADSEAEVDTDTANAGLCHFAMAASKPICVALDITDHLKNELTMRIMRDTIKHIEKNDATLILIDSKDKLPPVIRTYTRTFDISLPAEDQLEDIVKSTLRSIHRKTPIEIGN